MTKLKGGRHSQAIKAVRKSEKRRKSNRSVKSKIRTMARNVEEACQKGDIEKAKSIFRKAMKEWDKAAQKGVVRKRTSSRKKSRLAIRISSLTS